MVSEAVEKERYSFSKLSSWWTCPRGFKYRYLDHEEGVGNAFSSYGTLVHSIMERYAKGELRLSELVSVYEWEFDSAVAEKFPYNKFTNLRELYHKQGREFLQSFCGYGDDVKILGVEEEFEIPIDDWMFVGVIDLVFEKDGKLIIRDYKSKTSFKNDKERHKYARQLYLYALRVKEKYGRFPDELQFLMFRKNQCVSIQFCLDDFNEAKEWATQTVGIIREAFDYPPTCEEFYGQNLCNHREYCEYKIKSRNKTRRK